MVCLSASKVELNLECQACVYPYFFDTNVSSKRKSILTAVHAGHSSEPQTAVDVKGLLSNPCLYLSVRMHQH